jgi:hypothetical protein
MVTKANLAALAQADIAWITALKAPQVINTVADRVTN